MLLSSKVNSNTLLCFIIIGHNKVTSQALSNYIRIRYFYTWWYKCVGKNMNSFHIPEDPSLKHIWIKSSKHFTYYSYFRKDVIQISNYCIWAYSTVGEVFIKFSVRQILLRCTTRGIIKLTFFLLHFICFSFIIGLTSSRTIPLQTLVKL